MTPAALPSGVQGALPEAIQVLLQQPRGAPTAVALQRELSALAGSMTPNGTVGSSPAGSGAPAPQAAPSPAPGAVSHASTVAQAVTRRSRPRRCRRSARSERRAKPLKNRRRKSTDLRGRCR